MKCLWLNIVVICLYGSTAAMGQSTMFNTSFHYDQGADLLLKTEEFQEGYLSVGVSITVSGKYFMFAHNSFYGDSLLLTVYDNPSFFLEGRDFEIETDSTLVVGIVGINKSNGDYQYVFGRLHDLDTLKVLGAYGASNQKEILKRIIPTQDGNYLLVGTTQRSDALDAQMYLVKISPNGQELWSKEIGGVGFENVYDGLQLSDNGFIISGYKNFGGNNYQIWIVRTDSLGDVKWQKYYASNSNDFGSHIVESGDGGFIVSGTKIIKWPTPQEQAVLRGILLKIDSAGNQIWRRLYQQEGYENNDFWTGLIRDNGGGYVVLGSVEALNRSDLGWVYKVNSTGDSVWSRTYTRNAGKNNYLYNINKTADGGYILCGSTWDATQDSWVLKLDSLGCDTAGCNMPTGIGNNPPPIVPLTLHAFPNPATNFIHIRGRWPVTMALPGTRLMAHVVDLNGRVIRELSLMEMGLGDYSGTTSTSHLPTGLYLIRIVDEISDRVMGMVKVMVK